VQHDLEAFFSRLVPDGDPLFPAHCGRRDDIRPVRTALTTVNLSIPIANSRLVRGRGRGFMSGSIARTRMRAAWPPFYW